LQTINSCADFDLQEGVITTVSGLLTGFFVPATPMDVPFLTEHEKITYTRALAEDWSGDNDVEEFKWSEVFSCITNSPHTLLLCILLFFDGTSVSDQSRAFYTSTDALLCEQRSCMAWRFCE
jgi:hypothetical protein